MLLREREIANDFFERCLQGYYTYNMCIIYTQVYIWHNRGEREGAKKTRQEINAEKQIKTLILVVTSPLQRLEATPDFKVLQRKDIKHAKVQVRNRESDSKLI